MAELSPRVGVLTPFGVLSPSAIAQSIIGYLKDPERVERSARLRERLQSPEEKKRLQREALLWMGLGPGNIGRFGNMFGGPRPNPGTPLQPRSAPPRTGTPILPRSTPAPTGTAVATRPPAPPPNRMPLTPSVDQVAVAAARGGGGMLFPDTATRAAEGSYGEINRSRLARLINDYQLASESAGPGEEQLPVELLAEIMDLMRGGAGWYNMHKGDVATLFGEDAELFGDLLSATSQQAAVYRPGSDDNIMRALRAYHSIKTGEPLDPGMRAGRGNPSLSLLTGVTQNLERLIGVRDPSPTGIRAKSGQPMTPTPRVESALPAGYVLVSPGGETHYGGLKIPDMFEAMRGNVADPVIDRHIGSLTHGNMQPTLGQARRSKQMITEAAEMADLDPTPGQAAAWGFNLLRTGTPPEGLLDYGTGLMHRRENVYQTLEAIERSPAGRLTYDPEGYRQQIIFDELAGTGLARSIRDAGAPKPFAVRSGGDVGLRTLRPSARTSNRFRRVGASSFPITEVTHDPVAFHEAISDAMESRSHGSSVKIYSPDEYRNMQTFLSKDGTGGFALNGDDIVSVFNTQGGPNRRAGYSMIQAAVQLGGRRLDAFDTLLPHIYAANGFRAVARSPWDEEFAPEDWDKEFYKDFNNGEPDVVFMVYDPANSRSYNRGHVLMSDGTWGRSSAGDGQLMDSYDEAVAVQRRAPR